MRLRQLAAGKKPPPPAVSSRSASEQIYSFLGHGCYFHRLTSARILTPLVVTLTAILLWKDVPLLHISNISMDGITLTNVSHPVVGKVTTDPSVLSSKDTPALKNISHSEVTSITNQPTNPLSSKGTPASTQAHAEFCLHRRGTSGRWIQDWEYANRSHYPSHLTFDASWGMADQNFTPTPSQPYRLATSYRWLDDECPVSEVNISNFCNACLDLHVDQILVLGDSLSTEFIQSLSSLLGFPPVGRRATAFQGRYIPFTMVCPDSSHSIRVSHRRFSPIGDWKRLVTQNDNTTTAERKLIDDFLDGANNKTIVIANLGSWIQTRTEYMQGFTWFLEWLESVEDSKVIPFWRPTIPGHFNCRPGTMEERDIGETNTTERSRMQKSYNWIQPVLQEPYANYSEYRQINDNFAHARNASGRDTKRWPLLEEWNNWSYQKLYNSSSNNNVISTAEAIAALPMPLPLLSPPSTRQVHWLNIFPSAVLRRDGHCAFGDCLHYYQPGPIDWWAHFFHSALLDLASMASVP